MMKHLLFVVALFLVANLLNAQLSNQIVNQSTCGLSIINKSVRITNRMPDYQPMNPTPVTFNVSEFPVTCFDIEKAYVWWIISDMNEEVQNPVATIINPEGQSKEVAATVAGVAGSKAWGEAYTFGFRADVTDMITGNGDYSIDVSTEDIETDGITFFIIYKDYNADYEGHLIINDGLITKCGENSSQILSGFNACDDSKYAEAFLICSDLQVMRNLTDSLKTVELVLNNVTYTFTRDFWNSELVETSVEQGTTQIEFAVLAENNIEKECYSWVTMGIYFRTDPCQTCPEELPVNINAGSSEICPGEELTIAAQGGKDTKWPYYYSWSSDPPGFSSSAAEITVSPNQTTTYTCSVVMGDNCLTGSNSYTVNVHEKPIADAGDDKGLCLGKSVSIGNVASGGMPPYNYEWTPTENLADPFSAVTDASPQEDTEYILKVVDSRGCIDYDTVLVFMDNLEKPDLTALGETQFCPCGSVTLQTESGFVNYTWIYENSDTTYNTENGEPEFIADKEGNYRVMVENENGCLSISDPINVDLLRDTTVVSISDTVKAAPGENTILPIGLSSPIDLLDHCDFYDFVCYLRMNKTLFVPLSVPENNIIENTIVGNDRIIGFSGTRSKTSNLLKEFRIMATLGNAEFTDIQVDTFYWTDCAFEYQSSMSPFALDKLCEEGESTRLVRQTGTLMITVSPNPSYEKTIISCKSEINTVGEISLVDMLGREVLTAYKGVISKGTKEISLDCSDLSSGCYFVVLKTAEKTVSEILEVGK